MCYMDTQLPPKGEHHPPLFDPCLLWPNGRPSQLLLRSRVQTVAMSQAMQVRLGNGSFWQRQTAIETENEQKNRTKGKHGISHKSRKYCKNRAKNNPEPPGSLQRFQTLAARWGVRTGVGLIDPVFVVISRPMFSQQESQSA